MLVEAETLVSNWWPYGNKQAILDFRSSCYRPTPIRFAQMASSQAEIALVDIVDRKGLCQTRHREAPDQVGFRSHFREAARSSVMCF